jgi:hypothetical protein
MAISIAIIPPVAALTNNIEVEAASSPKPCKAGYFRSPITNRCKKIVSVSESTSTITTTTYNTKTGIPTIKKTCKAGYWWNAKTGRCNKKKTCAIGYYWVSSDNTCKKIVCSFGFKVQDASNLCKRIICESGHILNQKTGNCIINRNGKYKTCEAGWTLDLRTLECAKIGTKGSDDPASKNIKKSQNSINKYATKSPIKLSSIEVNQPNSDDEGTEESKKTCPEGKFLNPKTNRCKNLQEVSETSTGKTVTTYDPETGEATTVKYCNEGYYLNEETNRCNKIKEEKPTSSTSSTSSTTKTSVAKTCPEGKFLNPKTNRCKNLETVTESTTGKTVTTYDPETGEATTKKICNEGYELNEETNRCKKKKENKGEDYKLDVPELGDEKKTEFVGFGSIVATLAVGAGLVIFQFRKEIKRFLQGLNFRKKA